MSLLHKISKLFYSLNKKNIKLLWADILESISGTDIDFTKVKLSKSILLLSIPMVLEMVMEAIFALVDIIFLINKGTEEVAVVGLTESLLSIVYSIGWGLGIATTAIVARRIGENKPKLASLSGMQGILVGVFISIIIAIPGIIYSKEILQLMGASAKAVEIGHWYPKLMIGGNGIILLLFINNAIIRSSGDAALALRVLAIANGINIILDPCLIYGLGPFPELGVKGAAIATNIGRGTAVLYQFYLMFNGKHRIKLTFKLLKVRFKIMWELLLLSSGTIGQFLIATSSWIFLNRIMATYGDSAVAGYTVAIRVLIFTILPSWGMSNAAATLVGQNLGAGKPERAAKAAWFTTVANMIFLSIIAIFFITIPQVILGWVIKDDINALNTAINCMRILGYGFTLYAMGMVLVQAINGAGDTLTPTIINIICFWMIEIPLAYILTMKLYVGESGVFYSIIIAESAMAIIAYWVFKRGKWKTKVV
jgi:putative MATE family efflux protein